MHELAKAFAAAGYAAYALDIRGHGDSGDKGKIAYVGQLEDAVSRERWSVGWPQPYELGMVPAVTRGHGDCKRWRYPVFASDSHNESCKQCSARIVEDLVQAGTKTLERAAAARQGSPLER
jgi:pimeloyl-ACP methyl ester carboxylesterase